MERITRLINEAEQELENWRRNPDKYRHCLEDCRKRGRKKRGTERVPLFKRTCEYEYCKQEFTTSHSHQKYCSETCRRFNTLKKAKENKRRSIKYQLDNKSDLWDLGLRLSKDHYPGFTLGTGQVTTNLKVIDTPQGPRIKGARILERFIDRSQGLEY